MDFITPFERPTGTWLQLRGSDVEVDFSAGGDDGDFAFQLGVVGDFDYSAGVFDEDFSGGDVPEADGLLDVGVEASGADVREVEGGAAHEAAFAGAVDHFLQEGEAGVDGGLGF